jgi:hypothetical protein
METAFEREAAYSGVKRSSRDVRKVAKIRDEAVDALVELRAVEPLIAALSDKNAAIGSFPLRRTAFFPDDLVAQTDYFCPMPLRAQQEASRVHGGRR